MSWLTGAELPKVWSMWQHFHEKEPPRGSRGACCTLFNLVSQMTLNPFPFLKESLWTSYLISAPWYTAWKPLGKIPLMRSETLWLHHPPIFLSHGKQVGLVHLLTAEQCTQDLCVQKMAPYLPQGERRVPVKSLLCSESMLLASDSSIKEQR